VINQGYKNLQAAIAPQMKIYSMYGSDQIAYGKVKVINCANDVKALV